MDLPSQLVANTLNPIDETQVHSHAPAPAVDTPVTVLAPAPAPAPVEIPHFTIDQIRNIVIAAVNKTTVAGFEFKGTSWSFYNHNGRNYRKVECDITDSNTGYSEEHTIYFPRVNGRCLVNKLVIDDFTDDTDDVLDPERWYNTLPAHAPASAPLPQAEDDSRSKRSRPNDSQPAPAVAASTAPAVAASTASFGFLPLAVAWSLTPCSHIPHPNRFAEVGHLCCFNGTE